MLARGWRVSEAWARDAAQHAPEEAELRLDSSKAAQLLGWRTALPLPLALEWVADWHQDLSRGGDAAELCRAQIGAYATLLSDVPGGQRADSLSI